MVMVAVMMAVVAVGAVGAQRPVEILIEAEAMRVVRGWRVEGGSIFNGQPNLWSGARLSADAGDDPAVAEARIEVPESGRYMLWVHYESPYGFGAVFAVEIEQAGRRQRAIFGRKGRRKYFPFGRGWTVQRAWQWHGTDYVYECASVQLKRGPATVRLIKGRNERPGAMRVVDFIYLTTDPGRDPGDDWAWRGILTRFQVALRMRVENVGGDGRVLPMVSPRLWLIGYYKGPRDWFYMTRQGLVAAREGRPDESRWLGPGQATGWLELKVPTAMPAWLIFRKSGSARLRLSFDYRLGRRRVRRTLDWDGEELQVICPVGNVRYEKGLGGWRVITLDELVERRRRELEAYRPPGRPARRIFVRSAFRDESRFIALAQAIGLNAQAYGISPRIYAKGAQEKGFNTSRAFTSVQNWFLTRACLEGDFSALRQRLEGLRQRLEWQGVADVPITFKLIEEAGPPPLERLRQWAKVNERFREFLRAEGVKAAELLPRAALKGLDVGPGAAGGELWAKVALGAGTAEEARENPALYYWSHRFRAALFAETAARAVRLLEEIFGPGTRADSGSFYPSTGNVPVLHRGVEPFELFRRRGATWYSSEISWGWGGTPDFIGPQVASYEAALARALSKYHGCPMGTYIIADPHRGYTGDFVERYSFGLLAGGFVDLHFYTLAFPAECTFIEAADIQRAIKRVSYAVGAVEDYLVQARPEAAEVALTWLVATDVWDLAERPAHPGEVAGSVYPQERLLLYLALRHAGVPVDLIGEQDLADGYLRRYKALVLVGSHLSRKAGRALREWVRRGGMVVAVAGGGLRDEYDRPNREMLELFGLRGAELEKRQTCMRPKLELVHARPLARVRCSWRGMRGSFDAYAMVQRLEPGGAEVIARFDDGAAAGVVHRFGAGRAILIGALPGLAYVKPAIPLWPYGRGGTRELSNFVPTDFDAGVREFLKALVGSAGVGVPVEVSDPLVEATVLDGPGGVRYVALVNWRPRAMRPLRISVRLPGKWRAEMLWPQRRDLGGAEVELARGVRVFALLRLRPAE